MADFKRPYSKRPGTGGGKPSFGSSRFGGAGFGKKPWAGRDSSEKKTTFHKAICSKCGNSCEVPFRPVGGKPVLCRDCFVPTGERAGARADDRYSKRDSRGSSFGARPSYAPSSAPAESGAGNAAVLKQLEILNAKIERLIAIVASQNGTPAQDL